MELIATVSASPFDHRYEMAFVYCYDKTKQYCFSLSRFPDSDLIEIMVRDQINIKTNDLSVTLTGRQLVALLEKHLADRLDGHCEYVVSLDVPDDALPNLLASVGKIFEGKQGLTIVQT